MTPDLLNQQNQTKSGEVTILCFSDNVEPTSSTYHQDLGLLADHPVHLVRALPSCLEAPGLLEHPPDPVIHGDHPRPSLLSKRNCKTV